MLSFLSSCSSKVAPYRARHSPRMEMSAAGAQQRLRQVHAVGWEELEEEQRRGKKCQMN